MKKLFLATALFAGSYAVAQNIDDVKQAMYYERYYTAADKAHNLLKAKPSDADAWYWLAETYAAKKQAKQGLDSLSKAPAEVKNEPAFKVAMGHLLLKEGNKTEAQKLFDEAKSETKEKNAFILMGIARANIDAKAGDAQYAIDLLNKAAKRDKKNPEIYTLIGDAWRKVDNGTEAFKAYREAIDKDDNYAEAYYKLGEIFLTQKNADMYMDYFNQTMAKDSMYAPAYYQMYVHYFARDPQKAMDYFNRYQAKSDATEDNLYAYTDMLYLTKQYDKAISKAQGILKEKGAGVQPRIYKLLAYSYEGLKDTAKAYDYMQQYFSKEVDSNLVVKDFEAMANIYASMEGKGDSAAAYYQKAAAMEKDSTALFTYYKKLADLYKDLNNYQQQAQWLGKYYTGNKDATNIDLFNWGIAHYRAKEYDQADTVFGSYIKEHPDQGFGYYWRARANTLRDSAMEKGLAIPYYEQLVAIAEKDTANETNKKWLIEAYGYMAAYETNVNANYAKAIDYFQKLLVLNPANEDAKKYISILEKNLSKTGKTDEARADKKEDDSKKDEAAVAKEGK